MRKNPGCYKMGFAHLIIVNVIYHGRIGNDVLLGFFLLNLFTDIGYGNYLLTAPVERNKRQFWKADSEIPVEVEKIDVSDLLSLANTLTNPLAPSKKKKDKTEL
jgi:hypothetical protein